ncbi:MAG: DinB family protein [Salibacteraceae bacterium]
MNYLRQFQYNEEIIGKYIDVLNEHHDSPEKVKVLLSHVLNALEIWVSRVKDIKPKVNVWDVHDPSHLHHMNRDCHETIFSLLETGNLKKVHSYTNSAGVAYKNTLDEILTHLIIHSAHHRAQIASSWSEVGVEPPASDFIFWARGGVK